MASAIAITDFSGETIVAGITDLAANLLITTFSDGAG